MATLFAAPACGLYLFITCPTNDSFDGKKELKRVLRGEKLPEDHPQKPKGFLEKAMAKVSASLEAEAAAFAGCKIEIMVSVLYGNVLIQLISKSQTAIYCNEQRTQQSGYHWNSQNCINQTSYHKYCIYLAWCI